MLEAKQTIQAIDYKELGIESQLLIDITTRQAKKLDGILYNTSDLREELHRKGGRIPLITRYVHMGTNEALTLEKNHIPYVDADKIPYPVFRRIESNRPKHFEFKRVVNGINNTLHLTTDTLCVCAETGIIQTIKQSAPLGLEFEYVHPLALFSNVQKLVQHYQRYNLSFAVLGNNVLAGMLITILQHRKLTQCYNPAKANQIIQRCKPEVLIQCIKYFFYVDKTHHYPQIDLIEQSRNNAAEMLLSYLSICKGNDSTVQTLHTIERKAGKIRAKFVNNADEQQAKALKDNVKECMELLLRLEHEQSVVSKATMQLFTNKIQKLGILSDNAKQQLVNDLFDTFEETDTAKELSMIIMSNDTSAIQNELLTFTQQLANEVQEFQEERNKKPLDFKTLMGWNK